jgi:hypothetical protein
MSESKSGIIKGNREIDIPIADKSASSAHTIATEEPELETKGKCNPKSNTKPLDELSVMKKCASSNHAFILVKIPGTSYCLRYQGPKEKNIEGFCF